MQRAQIEELLTKAKQLLEPEVTNIAYTTWIKPLEIISMENNTIIFHVASNIHKDMIVGRYHSLIQNTFTFLTNINYEIQVISDEDQETIPSSEQQPNNQSIINSSGMSYNKSNLNPKYTFDSFVVGENNRFAHAAALAVSEAPRNCL